MVFTLLDIEMWDEMSMGKANSPFSPFRIGFNGMWFPSLLHETTNV